MELLAEEQRTGGEDPQGQAEAVLEESEDRTNHPAPAETHGQWTQTRRLIADHGNVPGRSPSRTSESQRQLAQVGSLPAQHQRAVRRPHPKPTAPTGDHGQEHVQVVLEESAEVKGHPQGLRESKRVVNRELLARIDEHGGDMAALSAALFCSDAAREAMLAFLSRAKPAT